jgi:3-deoxy-D-manno-octulosonic-acid transferase
VLFGPHTWNFKDTVARLRQQRAALAVADADDLEHQILRLLGSAPARAELGDRARRFVESQQGATSKTLDALEARRLAG